ncbi:WecB/TagA/CpsF family glycosyltransferase [Cellulomonas sp. PS-H5]|uniref:WecB/TagA/CpsF family glycosyltransferase n=1 Tax=Cellulomonas sp. PS-H5 TaxID=2820400 RepID=UPI001C4F3EFE|nr:WecB/TagA/CpsF family glycosyltransferase [Cellulomonas sp. PS-H5]MBW0255001.1 WecB/TagA/CpsF family glycosyltransferase [Cellulomonas sp. PS-H5]
MSSTGAHRAASSRTPLPWPRVLLGGTPVDLLETAGAVDTVVGHASRGAGWPLGVMSANLDHIHHFGYHGPSSLVPFAWAHPDAGDPYPAGPPVPDPLDGLPPVRWLNLLDGAPLVRRAEHLTGHAWPRLAGSDLIAPVLDRAASVGLRVGFLGGRPDVLDALAARLAADRPGLAVAGLWSPPRQDLDDAAACRAWAALVRHSGADVVVVGLGKPRQERWIARYGPLTGAAVLLAFGAVVDFLAGAAQRAPEAVRDHGWEWAWRLAHEPRRLARRYLVDGPPAYDVLARRSFVLVPGAPEPAGRP